jgi:hypothetical protein
MAEYDQIEIKSSEVDESLAYNGQNFVMVCAAFQDACRRCDPKVALHFALEAYFCGGLRRNLIIDKLFEVILADKGLADTTLFMRVYQLMVPLLTRNASIVSPFELGTRNETWIELPDYPGYLVSNLGQFKDERDHFVQIINRERYNYIILNKQYLRTDSLVMNAFKPGEEKKDFIIKHINEDDSNDTVENLIWVPLSVKKYKPKKGAESPFQFIKEIDYDDLNPEALRITYIYRFAVAVWITAVAPSSKINFWPILLFEDIENTERSEDKEKEYLEKYDAAENNKEYLLIALGNKNLYECLYYTKILHRHYQRFVGKVKWTKEKDAYVYIWECFTEVSSRGPEHMSLYLEKLRSLGTAEGWQTADTSLLLYYHFIHMWCFDPIAEFVTMNKDASRYNFLFGNVSVDQSGKTIVDGTVIDGYFTKDFRSKVKPGVKVHGRYVGYTKLDPKIRLLFPIDYSLLLEPTDHGKMEYIDPIDNVIKEFPDFIFYFDDVLDHRILDIDPYVEKTSFPEMSLENQVKENILDKIRLVNEDERWIPLTVFYGFLACWKYVECSEALDAVYGTPADFFQGKNLPNPFDLDSNIKGTDYESFRPYIIEVLGGKEEISKIGTTPGQRRRIRGKSTFDYRAIPSPIKTAQPITVVIGKRISPVIIAARNSPLVGLPKRGLVATPRSRMETPTPLSSPFTRTLSSSSLRSNTSIREESPSLRVVRSPELERKSPSKGRSRSVSRERGPVRSGASPSPSTRNRSPLEERERFSYRDRSVSRERGPIRTGGSPSVRNRSPSPSPEYEEEEKLTYASPEKSPSKSDDDEERTPERNYTQQVEETEGSGSPEPVRVRTRTSR